MLREVVELQKNAVSNLELELMDKEEITFKAPTGSGKTHMMADLMNTILSKKEVIFIVSSLSKGDLAKQNYDKFREYQLEGKFQNIKPFLINTETSGEERPYIPTDYNVYVLPRDLYKRNGKLMQGVMEQFIGTIKANTVQGSPKEIYLIKDECHIATKNLDALSKYFSKIVNISATPKLSRGQVPNVQITIEDAERVNLIKWVDKKGETDSLESALTLYKYVKTQYLEQVGINPCMIIQISNKEKADQEIEEIKRVLNKEGNTDLKWMLIVDKEKDCDTNDIIKTKAPVSKWKEYAKSNVATIDIIIFKMVITEGWDIPRANMLYQIRDTKSKQLNEQVLGRVRRNPCLVNFEKLSKTAQDLVMRAYVWGDIKNEDNIVNVKLKQSVENKHLGIKTTRITPNVVRTRVNLDVFVENAKKPFVNKSIFEQHSLLSNMSYELMKECIPYINSSDKWVKYANNARTLQELFDVAVCDYSKTMSLAMEDGEVKLVSFPQFSTYTPNIGSAAGAFGQNITSKNWVWLRQGKSNKSNFTFDSFAENEFIDKLLCSLGKNPCYIGKNFLTNSEIFFEYYMGGIHKSYPDFVLSINENIHIIEVKSLNESNKQILDKDGYVKKLEELCKCYSYASILTGYSFYIAIQSGSEWKIQYFTEGVQREVSYDDFEKIIKL